MCEQMLIESSLPQLLSWWTPLFKRKELQFGEVGKGTGFVAEHLTQILALLFINKFV